MILHKDSHHNCYSGCATHRQDAEIDWLVRLHLSEAQLPVIPDPTSQSEAAKKLAAQWDQLEVHDGLVNR